MKRKFTLLIAALALLTMIVQPGRAWGQTTETEDVTLSSGTYSTDHIVWSFADGNITIQQLKGTSSTAVNSNYIAAPRVYKGHYLSFVCSDNYTINSISIKCDGSYYGNSMTAGTVVSNNTVTSNTTDISATWTTTAGGSHVVSSVSDAGLPAIYIQNVASVNNTQLRITKLTITYTHTSSSATATTVTIDASGITNTDVYINTAAGSLSASVTETDSGDEVDGATVTWSSSDTNVATINENGVVTLVAAGTTTITASYAGESGVYSSSSSPYELTVTSSEPYVQPTTIEITPNYTFWGKTGQFSGNTYSELSGSKDNVSLYWTKGSGSTYANSSSMRFYKDNTLVFTAPTGYEIKSIVITFTTAKDDLSFSPEGYSLSGTTGTWAGSSATVTMSRPSNADSYAQISKFTITIGAASSLPTPTITIDATGITNTDLFAGTDAGSLSATVTYNDETVQGATVTWSGNNNAVATIDENSGAVTLVAAGSVTFTATFAGNESYNSATAQHVMTVTNDDPNAPGTVNNPYTVAQAIANTPSSGNVYIQGIVSSFYNTSIVEDGTNYRYYISDDGTTATQLLVYKGKGLNNETFDDINDLLVGDEVVIYGELNIYNNAPQIKAGNYLYSWNRPTHDVETPTFSPVAGTYAEAQSVAMSCTTEGAAIHYTTDGSEPDGNSDVYETPIQVSTTTTFKAKAIKGSDASTVATANYYICSQDDPYTVTEALAFEDYQYPANGIYVHGIVSTAPTQAPTSSGQLTYYISADGTTTDQLQVYKGKGLNDAAFTAQNDIQVGDIVTIFGNVKIYNEQKEFDQGNYLVEFERIPSISAENVNIAYDAEEGEIVYTINNPVEGGALTADTEVDWIYLDDYTDSPIAFICDVNTATTARSATVTLTYTYDTNKTVTKDVTVTQGAAPSPAIAVTSTSIEVDHNEHNGTLNVTYTMIDLTKATTVFVCDSDGSEASYDWFEAEIDSDKNVYYVIGVNDGEARTAYFKVKGKDYNNNDVYSELVTVNQAEYVVDYATLPFAFDGGRADIANTTGLTQEGLDSDYASGPKLKFNGTGDWVILKINERPGILTFDINGNSFSGGTFKVQTSADGETYTDLQSYTDLGATQSEEFDNLGENVRYIKWIYTNKSSGNVGLGNIALAKYVAPVPSITLEDNSIEAGANTGLIGGIEVTYNNIESVNAEIWFCNAEGNATATYDWLTVGFDKDNNITYNINPNTGDARTAYFKVHETSENVYSELVTVSQEAPEPNITLEEYLIEAGSNTGLIGGIEVTYANYDNPEDIESEVWFCNAEGTADATYDHTWLTVSFDKDNNITYNINPNTGDARTAYFKVHETSEDIYSNVVTVTQAELVVYYSVTFNLDGGTFVANEAFPTSEESKPAGTYTLPSATKSGLTFDGWKLDGTDDIYDAGAQYEVTGNVSFTAQWSSAVTGTITFGNADGSTNINSTSVTGDDSAGNTWTITTVFSGDISFTPNSEYAQIGSSKKPASSITFTTTLANEVNITAFSAKFGGFSNTAGDIALIVDETTIGTGSLNASEDVVVTNTTTESGTVLTVTVTNIAKGVKCYYISYTYEVNTDPYITIADNMIEVPVEGDDDYIAIAYGNLEIEDATDFDIQFYDDDNQEIESPSWIEADVTTQQGEDGYFVYYIIGENTGTDDRSAYFKVKGIDANNSPVYSALVTINQAAPAVAHSITIDSNIEHGTVVANQTSAVASTTITLTVTPDSGYQLASITATKVTSSESITLTQDGDNYTFAMPEDDVLVTATFTEIPAGVTYTLVETNDDIEPGLHYIIVGIGTDNKYYAMAEQRTNNRGEVIVTATGNTIAEVSGIHEFVISGDETNLYTIYDESDIVSSNVSSNGYLYAAGANSNNYLKTYLSVDNKGQWTININETTHKASIVANMTGRNTLRYNYGSGVFSCYTGGQQDIYLYKKNNDKTYNFYSNTTVASLTVANDGACIVHEDVALNVTGTITNNGGADNLLIKDGGQLIHTEDVEATVQENVSAWTTNGGWYFIASPVDNLQTSAVTGINNEGHYDLFAYDEENALWRSNTGLGAGAPFTTLERGKGYLYANESDVTLSFAGLMIGTATEVTKTLSRAYPTENDNVKGYNLMGNPYTRNLKLGDITVNDTIWTSFLLLNSDGSEYEECDFEDGDVIKPGQGFFIQAESDGQILKFKQASSKDEMVDKGFIRIAVGNDNNMDKAYIHVKNGNTLRKIAFTNSSSVYVMNHGDDYAAARVEELAGTMPVHFDAAEDGEYTITITAKNIEAHSMHLIDNFTGEVIDLLVNSSYTFFANESDDPARFRLAFDFNDYTGVNESYVNGSFAYQIGDELIVNGDGTLQVFDVMGRYVGSYEVHGSERISVSAYNTGVYMLRFVGKNVMTQKIVVR